ncbi:prepilin-type N-terminal cleavage/methylation domain-containing protein [Marilutibacter alkalisoli]|uniref:Prepilin-type N-terminal cleavage/methylation domain-containing protein n=1 Tax=Marilutibacter alkalisoli TaxID=2591633 RepID=A0A514BX47_9GAMM|nr:prepilin-type N-terminal cleavage/methylation domain-containing protein [Lysobacter alkalisoli]QDH71875.1 prepilin-type N-terminal cleavage/methylation domain-containing protein [Lysobacter alkalisoli]
MVRRRTHGFTLIEVLLATVLLAAGLALAFATLTAATTTINRGEAMAQRAERERAVLGFLRQRMMAARTIAFEVDPATTLPMRFVGEPGRIRFVADLPDYLGYGGPYLHDFRIEEGEGGARIVLALTVVQSAQTWEEADPRPPELLVDRLGEARFRYRALTVEGELSGWEDRWEASEQLPLLVEVTLTDADGRPWPPLVVALPQAGSLAGANVVGRF